MALARVVVASAQPRDGFLIMVFGPLTSIFQPLTPGQRLPLPSLFVVKHRHLTQVNEQNGNDDPDHRAALRQRHGSLRAGELKVGLCTPAEAGPSPRVH